MEKADNIESNEKVFLGSIAILYRINQDHLEFLVVENSKTRNITFVSGAKENIDSSEMNTINREIQEELGLQTKNIKLQPTDVRHDFIFGSQKKDRAGQHGSYQVFLADVTDISNSISHTDELLNIRWLSKDEVLNSLSFSDLKEVFLKAISPLHVSSPPFKI